MNAVMAELLAILSAAGIAPSKSTSNQVLTALQALFDPVTSFGLPGYVKLPGGLIIQWGFNTVPDQAVTTITLPIAFTSAGYVAIADVGTSIGLTSATVTVGADILSLTQIRIAAALATTGTVGVSWIAIGK